MMSGLASRIVGRGGVAANDSAIGGATSGTLGFAAKMIGIGLCAGIALCCCQFLIDTFFRTIR
jgi:hypothetical protein